MNVHSNIIYDSQKVEISQISMKWSMDKKWYIHVLEYYNMNELWKDYAEKDSSYRYIFYNSIYTKCPV
jgi:hypothetical protein